MPSALSKAWGFRCGPTFELSGERRCGAWPARRKISQGVSRAKCHAGASPLERRVGPHSEQRATDRQTPQMSREQCLLRHVQRAHEEARSRDEPRLDGRNDEALSSAAR